MMAAKKRKPAARFQDMPPEIVTAILDRIGRSAVSPLVLAVKKTRMLGTIQTYEQYAPIRFRMDISTQTSLRSFGFDGIMGELRSNRLVITALEADMPQETHLTNETFFRDSLGDTVFQERLRFPRLRRLVLDSGSTFVLDLLLYLVDIAPNLDTLHVSVLSPLPIKIDSTPHNGILNLHITLSDQQISVDAAAQLLGMCPNVQRLFLYRSSIPGLRYTLAADWATTDKLVRRLSGLPIIEFESAMKVSSFALCAARRNFLLPEVRRMWLTLPRPAFGGVLYFISESLATSWPSFGLCRFFAGCLRNCPKLDTLYQCNFAEVGSACSEPEAYVSSYTNPAGIGELLHAIFRLSTGWEQATDYRGEVVPLDIIDIMRAAEGLTDEAWSGTERGRGRVVGHAAWTILTEWYMNGTRIPRAHTPWIPSPREKDDLRGSCCLQ